MQGGTTADTQSPYLNFNVSFGANQLERHAHRTELALAMVEDANRRVGADFRSLRALIRRCGRSARRVSRSTRCWRGRSQAILVATRCSSSRRIETRYAFRSILRGTRSRDATTVISVSPNCLVRAPPCLGRRHQTPSPLTIGNPTKGAREHLRLEASTATTFCQPFPSHGWMRCLETGSRSGSGPKR